jgi:cysteate synthase
MLNVTGGGEKRFKTQKELHFLKPDLIFDLDPDPDVVKNEVKKLFNL